VSPHHSGTGKFSNKFQNICAFIIGTRYN